MTATQAIGVLCACVAVLGVVLGQFHRKNDKLEAENKKLEAENERLKFWLDRLNAANEKPKHAIGKKMQATDSDEPLTASTLTYRPCRWAWAYCDGNCKDCLRRQYTTSDMTED